ncbi:MAG: hypothetical protein ABI629_15395 [bacterium]
MLIARHVVRLACALSLSVLLGSPGLADDGSLPAAGESAEHNGLDAPAIPPNQEALLGAMLGGGATLPGGCTLSSGNVEHTIVKATYACQGGEVVIELAHPSTATQPAVSTEHFALTVVSGVPPTELTGALAGLIRARESEFVWMVPSATSRAPHSTALLAMALVLGMALLAWAWRRRRAQRAGRAAPEV